MYKTLILGASLHTYRYSNMAIKKLVENDIDVVAIGLRKGIVARIPIDTELKQYKNIHTVSLYLNPQRQKEYYNYIISLEPKRIIFNPGTENFEFIKLLEEKNIHYEIACTLVMLSLGNYTEEI